MKVALIVILVIVLAVFIWQAVLFIRDLIKFIKKKKADKLEKAKEDNQAVNDDTARKEK